MVEHDKNGDISLEHVKNMRPSYYKEHLIKQLRKKKKVKHTRDPRRRERVQQSLDVYTPQPDDKYVIDYG